VNSYQKGQAAKALYSSLANAAVTIGMTRVPKTFFNRIDKLVAANVGPRDDGRAGGPGQNNRFSEGDIFLLAVGLMLLDAEIPLGAVGFFMHHARETLLGVHKKIMENPPARCAEKERTDKMVYLLFNTSGIREFYIDKERTPDRWNELYHFEGWSGKGPAPLFINAKYAFGKKSLYKEIDRRLTGSKSNHVLIIELAQVASRLSYELENTPAAKRGRQ